MRCRLSGERLLPLRQALVADLQAFEQCAGIVFRRDIASLAEAVRRCVHILHGISAQYVYRSMYAAQLHACFRSLPRRQFLILPAEELQSDPAEVLGRVWTFLGLPPAADTLPLARSRERMHDLVSTHFPSFEAQSGWTLSGGYDALSENIRQALTPFFRYHNELLGNYLFTNAFSQHWAV